MAIKNLHSNNSLSIAVQIFLCIFLLFCTVLGTWGMYEYGDTDELYKKISFNVLAAGSLGLLVNLVTNMFFGESKRKELAGTTYNSVYAVVNLLLIKAETEGLTQSEFATLSQLSDVLGYLSKYCDVNIDTINNKYVRIQNNPNQFVRTNTTVLNLYGAEQAYNETLLKHQHHQTTAASGSGAPPVLPQP